MANLLVKFVSKWGKYWCGKWLKWSMQWFEYSRQHLLRKRHSGVCLYIGCQICWTKWVHPLSSIQRPRGSPRRQNSNVIDSRHAISRLDINGSQNQSCLLYSQGRATFKIWGATVIAEIKRSHNKQHKGKQEKLCRTCFFLCLTAFSSYMQNHDWKRAISEP